MPRQKKHDRPQRKELNIPTSVCAAIDEKLRDKYTGRPIHGGWSGLVSKLLKEWLEKDEMVEKTDSKQTFCPTCLVDLPLTEACLLEGCTYERVTNNPCGSTGRGEVEGTGAEDRENKEHSNARDSGAVEWSESDLRHPHSR